MTNYTIYSMLVLSIIWSQHENLKTITSSFFSVSFNEVSFVMELSPLFIAANETKSNLVTVVSIIVGIELLGPTTVYLH